MCTLSACSWRLSATLACPVVAAGSAWASAAGAVLVLEVPDDPSQPHERPDIMTHMYCILYVCEP